MSFLYFLLTCICGIGYTITSSFTLMKLWNWFAAPTFGTAQIGLWRALGLFAIVSFIRGIQSIKVIDGNTEEPSKPWSAKAYKEFLTLLTVLVISCLSLLSGYLVHGLEATP